MQKLLRNLLCLGLIFITTSSPLLFGSQQDWANLKTAIDIWSQKMNEADSSSVSKRFEDKDFKSFLGAVALYAKASKLDAYYKAAWISEDRRLDFYNDLSSSFKKMKDALEALQTKGLYSNKTKKIVYKYASTSIKTGKVVDYLANFINLFNDAFNAVESKKNKIISDKSEKKEQAKNQEINKEKEEIKTDKEDRENKSNSEKQSEDKRKKSINELEGYIESDKDVLGSKIKSMESEIKEIKELINNNSGVLGDSLNTLKEQLSLFEENKSKYDKAKDAQREKSGWYYVGLEADGQKLKSLEKLDQLIKENINQIERDLDNELPNLKSNVKEKIKNGKKQASSLLKKFDEILDELSGKNRDNKTGLINKLDEIIGSKEKEDSIENVIDELEKDIYGDFVSDLNDEFKKNLRLIKEDYQKYLNEVKIVPVSGEILKLDQQKGELNSILNKVKETIVSARKLKKNAQTELIRVKEQKKAEDDLGAKQLDEGSKVKGKEPRLKIAKDDLRTARKELGHKVKELTKKLDEISILLKDLNSYQGISFVAGAYSGHYKLYKDYRKKLSKHEIKANNILLKNDMSYLSEEKESVDRVKNQELKLLLTNIMALSSKINNDIVKAKAQAAKPVASVTPDPVPGPGVTKLPSDAVAVYIRQERPKSYDGKKFSIAPHKSLSQNFVTIMRDRTGYDKSGTFKTGTVGRLDILVDGKPTGSTVEIREDSARAAYTTEFNHEGRGYQLQVEVLPLKDPSRVFRGSHVEGHTVRIFRIIRVR